MLLCRYVASVNQALQHRYFLATTMICSLSALNCDFKLNSRCVLVRFWNYAISDQNAITIINLSFAD